MTVLSGIGNVLLTILKWMLKIILGILRLILEVWLMQFGFNNYFKNRRFIKYFFAMKKLADV